MVLFSYSEFLIIVVGFYLLFFFYIIILCSWEPPHHICTQNLYGSITFSWDTYILCCRLGDSWTCRSALTNLWDCSESERWISRSRDIDVSSIIQSWTRKQTQLLKYEQRALQYQINNKLHKKNGITF